MSSFLLVIHVVVAVILVISVLLQAGKGGGMGAAFGGGSSSSLFGAQGPATLMSKITTASAIIFMVTSLSLSLFIKDSHSRRSLMEGAVETSVSDSAGATAVPPGGMPIDLDSDSADDDSAKGETPPAPLPESGDSELSDSESSNEEAKPTDD